LNQHFHRLQPLVFLLVLIVQTGLLAAQDDMRAAPAGVSDLTHFPRIEHFGQGTVQVDFPTLDVWPAFQTLTAWLPVEVRLKPDERPRIGSAYVQARTAIDFEQRTVRISGQEVLETRFSSADDSGEVRNLVSRAFRGRESVVPLDILLRLLPDDFEIPETNRAVSKLNFTAPDILVSGTPLKLLSIDKEPVRAEVNGTRLEWVVNTNWNVFYYRPDSQWYVLNGDTWQLNNYLSNGGWITVDKLPDDFDRLALDDRWKDVHRALPARKPDTEPTPFVISLQATELVLIDGAPQLEPVAQTGISFVSNTESDLFRFGEQWYFLVSGRWFESEALDGEWKNTEKLPDAFSTIPSDHARGHVLYSVPGTRQARLALIEAAIPRPVTVPRDAGEELRVTWVGEPNFEVIDRTELERGVNTPFQVIRHNNHYYLCYEGAWFFSDSPDGGWKPALRIPDEIYRIPASDPAYNVTFVRLSPQQDESRPVVQYQYSSGYSGSYSTRVSVVYGTGWYYPSKVYWDSGSGPAYWHYWQTYGYNVGYHPVGAYYGGRGSFYRPWRPYGGWGGYGYWGAYPRSSTLTIESPSVNFTHGYGSAWEGPLQTTPGDPTSSGQRSLERFLPARQATGKEVFVKTSKEDAAKSATISASSLYAGASLSSNRISGLDGEVYQREGEQWQQYSEGNWDTMKAIGQNQPVPRQAPIRTETTPAQGFVPAHKRSLSRSELDRQELARLEGMDSYAKYRVQKEEGN
jgi:hypothetical protein